MSVGIEFQTDQTQVVEKKTRQFIENLPKFTEEVGEQVAEDLEEAIKDSVEQKFNRFEGDLRDNVEARKVGRTSSGGTEFEVTANAYSDDGVNYAAWHEYANTSHFAYLEDEDGENRELAKWARLKGIFSDVWRIEVTPVNQRLGSFMAPAVQKTIKQARRDARSGNNAVSKGLKALFGG